MEILLTQSISFFLKATYMKYHYDNFAIHLTNKVVNRRNGAETFFNNEAMVLPRMRKETSRPV